MYQKTENKVLSDDQFYFLTFVRAKIKNAVLRLYSQVVESVECNVLSSQSFP
jgi:hypothetical protein